VNRQRAIPLGLAAACYLLALVQRPGLVYADTKVDLHVDPIGFLGDVASAWTEQIQLGTSSAASTAATCSRWRRGSPAARPRPAVVGRAPPVAGDRLRRRRDRRGQAARRAARPRPRRAARRRGVLFVLNPYVAVYANRTSITLLAYAALPWLLLAVHRGLRDPRGWRWPRRSRSS
jgi:hypothetical protein